MWLHTFLSRFLTVHVPDNPPQSQVHRMVAIYQTLVLQALFSRYLKHTWLTNIAFLITCQVLDWANQYGGLFRFCIGHQYIVVVTDPVLVAQILGRGEASAPRKCVAYQFFDLVSPDMALPHS